MDSQQNTAAAGIRALVCGRLADRVPLTTLHYRKLELGGIGQERILESMERTRWITIGEAQSGRNMVVPAVTETATAPSMRDEWISGEAVLHTFRP